jgi:hypothetical protein
LLSQSWTAAADLENLARHYSGRRLGGVTNDCGDFDESGSLSPVQVWNTLPEAAVHRSRGFAAPT